MEYMQNFSTVFVDKLQKILFLTIQILNYFYQKFEYDRFSGYPKASGDA
jgi:hypothetical protein